MLKICSETLQKPCRSFPKRPNKPRTRQTSQKLPPKLPKFAKSLPKVAPKHPKGSQKASKSYRKAFQKAPKTIPKANPEPCLKNCACAVFRASTGESYKPVLAWEQEARFNLKKLQANVETRRGNKETLQSMCKDPSPPTSPPTQATAFANIAQHWLD